MLAAYGYYCPTILRTRSHWRQLVGEHLEHGIYRLVQVEDGVHRVRAGGRSYRCGPETLYLLGPGQRESWEASARSHAQMVAFTVTPCALQRGNGQTLEPVDPDHCQPDPQAIWGVELPVVIDPALVPRLQASLQFILTNPFKDDWSRYRATRQLADLLDCLVEHYLQGPAPASKADGDAWLTKVLGVIHDDLARIPHTKALAAILGLSPDHLSRRFIMAMGESLSTYLRRYRLEQVEDLLRYSDWTIGTIATHLGYRSQAALNQAWSRRHEQPPLRWRMQWRR